MSLLGFAEGPNCEQVLFFLLTIAPLVDATGIEGKAQAAMLQQCLFAQPDLALFLALSVDCHESVAYRS